MRSIEFVNGGFYHVFNRGVDHRQVFNGRTDYERFIESMYLFNDDGYIHPGGHPASKLMKLARAGFLKDERKPFVRIISYCLLPNHFHLFLEQLSDGGISKFLHKLGGGYSKYFNIKHQRKGNLFEKSYGAVAVVDEAHFRYLPCYIHLNALDLTDLAWREGKIAEADKIERLLETYPWSSHNVFAGGDQKLPVVDRSFVRELFPDPKEYLTFVKGWTGEASPVPSTGDDVPGAEHRVELSDGGGGESI